MKSQGGKNFLLLIVFSLFSTSIFSYNKKEAEQIALIPINELISFPDKNIPLLRKTAQEAFSVKDYLIAGKCFKHLGSIYAYKGMGDSAVYFTQQAIQTFEQGNFISEAGYIYCERAYRMKYTNLAKAEVEMLKGLRMIASENDKQGLAGQYNNFGVIKELKHQLDSARYYYQLSINYKYELKDSLGLPYSILNIGVLFGRLKEFKSATDSILKAASLFEKQNNIPPQAECYYELATIYEKSNTLTKAKDYFNKAIRTALPASYLQIQQRSHERLALILEAEGNLRQSLVHQKQNIKLKDSILGEARSKQITQLETKFDVAKKEKQIVKQQLKIQKRDNQLLLGLIAIGLFTFGVFYYIKRLRFKKKLEKIAYENKMRLERERISRDLHDNIGSQLAFIISGAGLEQNNKNEQLAQIASFAKDTLDQLRTTVWAIKKEKISNEEFYEQIKRFIEKIKPNSLIEFKINRTFKHQLFLSPTQSVHLFRVIQESISNAIKHSDCFSIIIDLSSKNEQLEVSIQDDGKGFDIKHCDKGNGLRFMEQRLQELGGSLTISSSSHGTIVNCKVNTTYAV